jgi:hypothetical protein
MTLFDIVLRIEKLELSRISLLGNIFTTNGYDRLFTLIIGYIITRCCLWTDISDTLEVKAKGNTEQDKVGWSPI